MFETDPKGYYTLAEGESEEHFLPALQLKVAIFEACLRQQRRRQPSPCSFLSQSKHKQRVLQNSAVVIVRRCVGVVRVVHGAAGDECNAAMHAQIFFFFNFFYYYHRNRESTTLKNSKL